jgi:hypothetical protein
MASDHDFALGWAPTRSLQRAACRTVADSGAHEAAAGALDAGRPTRHAAEGLSSAARVDRHREPDSDPQPAVSCLLVSRARSADGSDATGALTRAAFSLSAWTQSGSVVSIGGVTPSPGHSKDVTSPRACAHSMPIAFMAGTAGGQRGGRTGVAVARQDLLVVHTPVAGHFVSPDPSRLSERAAPRPRPIRAARDDAGGHPSLGPGPGSRDRDPVVSAHVRFAGLARSLGCSGSTWEDLAGCKLAAYY